MAAAGGVAAAVTVGCIVASASSAAGGLAGVAAGLLLLGQLERILLGSRLWPDTWLGLWVALAVLRLASMPLPLTWPPILSLLAVLALLTRLDGAALGLGIAAACLALDTGAFTAAAPLGAVLVVSLALALRNQRRYGVPLPDDTWAFNLLVRSQAEELGPASVEEGVRRAFRTWCSLPAPGRWRNTGGLPSGSCWIGILRRIAIYLGPDRFVSDRLLGRWPRPLVSLLGLSFPVLAGVALVTAPSASQQEVAVACLGAPLILAAVCAHTRTRYRVVVMPVLAHLGGVGIARVIESGGAALAGPATTAAVVALLAAAAAGGRHASELVARA
jgi:hypothetical protein